MSFANRVKRELRSFFSWNEAKEWIIAFVAAAVFYFILLPALLGTSSPGIVVSSCSEQGYLNIGDVLVLQGVRIEDVKAPLVTVDKYAGFTPVVENNRVNKIVIGNVTITANSSNDIIVYRAFPYNIEIIHRALARVNTSKGMLLLTKGDANQLPDQMTLDGKQCIDENVGCISTPVTQRMLVGKQALFPLPLLGHVKLFFCDLTFSKLCDGHANYGTGYDYKLWC